MNREQIEAIKFWTGDGKVEGLCNMALEALELRAENERLQQAAVVRRNIEDELVSRIDRLRAENERLLAALHEVIDAADSFKDDDGHEVAAQVKIRARAALERKPDGHQQ